MEEHERISYSHDTAQQVAELHDILAHRDDMLLEVLLVHVLAEVQALLIADLDVTDVQRVDYRLDSFRGASRRCGESEQAEVRVLRHQEADDTRIIIITSCFVRLVWSQGN